MAAVVTTLKPSQAAKGASNGAYPNASATLKSAATATLKFGGQDGSTLLLSAPTMMKNSQAKQKTIRTGWDGPKPSTEHTKKMAKLHAGVQRMDTVFQDATDTRSAQLKMMDDMHDYTMERVEQTKVEMEQILEELAVHFKAFCEESMRKLRETFDELGKQMAERIAAMNARFAGLEARTRSLQHAIDEERADRLRETESLLGPIRKTVEDLAKALEKENQIRRNRDEELRAQLVDSVRMLAETCDTEEKTRQVKHTEIVKDCDAELERLRNRTGHVETVNAGFVVAIEKDLESERLHRKEGQDRIADRITDFIHKFQAHIKEEAEMGN